MADLPIRGLGRLQLAQEAAIWMFWIGTSALAVHAPPAATCLYPTSIIAVWGQDGIASPSGRLGTVLVGGCLPVGQVSHLQYAIFADVSALRWAVRREVIRGMVST